jgi:hypothetical protein
MARSGSNVSRLRNGPLAWMDAKIRRSHHNYERQGSAFFRRSVGGNLSTPLHLTCAKDNIPPTGEWVGGVFSPPIKGCTLCPLQRSGLEQLSIVGHATDRAVWRED